MRYEVIDEGYEWRGRVRVIAESGDALDVAGHKQVEILLSDTIPNDKGITVRQARLFVDDSDEAAHAFLVEPPALTKLVELQAEVALQTFLRDQLGRD
jgi:hypothetical protein